MQTIQNSHPIAPTWIDDFAGLVDQVTGLIEHVGRSRLEEVVRSHRTLSLNSVAVNIAKGSSAQKKFLSTKDLSKMTGLSEDFFSRKRIEGGGPLFTKAGSKVIYDISDVEEWLKKVRSTAEARTRPDLRGKPRVGKGQKRTSRPTQVFAGFTTIQVED